MLKCYDHEIWGVVHGNTKTVLFLYIQVFCSSISKDADFSLLHAALASVLKHYMYSM